MKTERSVASPSMMTMPRNAEVPPELPRYEPQPEISMEFITSPYGDPRFGIGAVTAELEAGVELGLGGEAELEGDVEPEADGQSQRQGRS